MGASWLTPGPVVGWVRKEQQELGERKQPEIQNKRVRPGRVVKERAKAHKQRESEEPALRGKREWGGGGKEEERKSR